MSVKKILFLIVFTFAFSLFGQIPQTLNYQCVLTDADGNPLPDGVVSVTFRLYDEASSETAIWNETQSIQITSGVLNANLGVVNPLDLPFDKQYWLGIQISEDEELTPRIALTASPYSLNSRAQAGLQPGQDLIVRDFSGAVTHQLASDGNALHEGTGLYKGGLIVGTPPSPGKSNNNKIKSGDKEVLQRDDPVSVFIIYDREGNILAKFDQETGQILEGDLHLNNGRLYFPDGSNLNSAANLGASPWQPITQPQGIYYPDYVGIGGDLGLGGNLIMSYSGEQVMHITPQGAYWYVPTYSYGGSYHEGLESFDDLDIPKYTFNRRDSIRYFFY